MLLLIDDKGYVNLLNCPRENQKTNLDQVSFNIVVLLLGKHRIDNFPGFSKFLASVVSFKVSLFLLRGVRSFIYSLIIAFCRIKSSKKQAFLLVRCPLLCSIFFPLLKHLYSPFRYNPLKVLQLLQTINNCYSLQRLQPKQSNS